MKQVSIGVITVIAIMALAARLTHAASSVGTFTLTIPAGTALTMEDPSATLPIRVTNNAATATIKYVRLDFDKNIYYLSNANVGAAPTGWTVAEIKNAGAGQAYIVYTTTTNPIEAAGDYETFNVILTGFDNGNIPSAAVDQTDAVIDDQNSTVIKTVNAANSDYFTLSGSPPSWSRKAFYATMTASPSTVGINGEVTFNFTVTNRSTGAQDVMPLISQPAVAGASHLSGPDPASENGLDPGESATFQWTYQANSSGSLRLCNSARNSAGSVTSTSAEVCSAWVAVGAFTATLSLSPTQVVTGQNVIVEMNVTNTSTTPLNNISPTALTFERVTGSTSASVCSGPTPTTGNLPGGSSSTFQWTCTITGQVAETFQYTGYATSGGVNSVPQPATSNLGTISAYSVTVTPDSQWYGNTNVPFTFRVRNTGGNAVFKVQITSLPAGFSYSAGTASGGCTTAWNVATSGTPVQDVTYSTSNSCSCVSPASCIPCTTGACDFSLTFSSLPDVSANVNSSTDFNFRVDIWDTPLWHSGVPPRASVGVIIKITKNNILLEAVSDSIFQGCTAELVSTVTPTPPTGSTVSFQPIDGGTVYSATTTTGNGEAYATFKAPRPCSAGNQQRIRATYQDVYTQTTVTCSNASSCSDVRRFRWKEVVR